MGGEGGLVGVLVEVGWGGEGNGREQQGLKWMLREQMGLLFFLYAVKGIENKSGGDQGGGRILLDNAADGRRRMRNAQARCRDA